jgi:hypothetical protein
MRLFAFGINVALQQSAARINGSSKMSNEAVTVRDSKSLFSLFQRVWPAAFLVLGLGVTVVWTTILGYGFVRLVEMAL